MKFWLQCCFRNPIKMMSLFLSSLTIYYTKITKSGKMTVPLYGISLFFELDAWNFGSSIVFETLNINKSIFIWLNNSLYKTHNTGKMKVPLSSKNFFWSWTKQFWLQHCFSKSSWFLPSLTFCYIRITESGKIRVPLYIKSLFLD